MEPGYRNGLACLYAGEGFNVRFGEIPGGAVRWGMGVVVQARNVGATGGMQNFANGV